MPMLARGAGRHDHSLDPAEQRDFHAGVNPFLLRRAWPLPALAAMALALSAGAAESRNAARASGPPPDYERDIKPLLQQRCYACHSRLKSKGGLRLDAGALIHKGGKDGPAFVAGRSTESLLIEKVLAKDEDERMPPEGKALTTEEVALLRAWIDAGAQYPKNEVVPSAPAEHWSFQPVRRPAVPAVKREHKRWARNEIDAFVLAKLDERGLKPSASAPAQALLRRVHLDLTGLPPMPEEQEKFLKDTSREALSRVVDDLLSRQSYGERWARHWLDVARYADSNGYERDAEKPFVWRYRDYVIRALNEDKPFDRFVVEQLAGDELPDSTAETVIATGFLRLGHWDDEPADPAVDRYDQLDDIVSTTSQAFLGLTLGCARCHDHKFEPLSAKDYYSMVAVFNPLQRPQNGRSEETRPAGSRQELDALAARDAAIAKLQAQTNTLTHSEIQKGIQVLHAATPNLPKAYVWDEPGPTPPATHVLLRGSPARKGEEVQPAVPAVLVKGRPAELERQVAAPRAGVDLKRAEPEFGVPGERTSQRRLALAQWLASPTNPLTARVIVNRVWQHHFGHGLVRTPNDFGLMGEAPSHPEMLDWLADWFVRDAGWSLKKLHRLILGSATWRQASGIYDFRFTIYEPAGGPRVNRKSKIVTRDDPNNRFLSRFPYRRLEAEAIRDSMLAVSGRLNPKMFGPAMKPPIPEAALEANTDKEKSWKASEETEASRRTVYAFIKRGLVVPMLEVLDLADTVSSCAQRQVTTVAPQALSLFNGDFVNEQARHFASRLEREAGAEPRQQVDLAWRLALCRPPTQAEMAAMLEFRHEQPGREGREQMCRVVLNLNEFVYSD